MASDARLKVLTWNVFHGRDFPPDQSLRTRRSRLLRLTERNETHAQVNRDLTGEFVALLAGAGWDVALLQECPPRWRSPLELACGAASHRVLTSRNSVAPLRRLAARVNPDLTGSNEGGSNLTLSRGRITERREHVLCPGPRPERRTMALTRLGSGLCIANLHASAGPALRGRAEAELLTAAESALEWAGGAPLVLGGDLNVRSRQSEVYAKLEAEIGLRAPTAGDSLDHLLARGLELIEAPAPWPPARRDVIQPDGLRVRLSDHAPVEAVFGAPAKAADG